LLLKFALLEAAWEHLFSQSLLFPIPVQYAASWPKSMSGWSMLVPAVLPTFSIALQKQCTLWGVPLANPGAEPNPPKTARATSAKARVNDFFMTISFFSR
jgi:hypothetical protein